MGHARQLRRRPHRLPAARRAARLDRRHPGVRAHRVVPLRLRGHAAFLAGRPRRRAARGPRGDRAVYVPFIPCCRSRVQADVRLGRRRGHRAVGALPALRRRGLLAAQFDSDARWVDVVAAAAGDGPRLGEGRRSSFGDWLDPTRRRTTRGGPHPVPSVATAYLARSARSSRRPPRCSAATAARYADLAERARRFRAEYVTPTGRMACRPRRRTRSRCIRPARRRSSGSTPAAARRAGGRRRLAHRHRVRRHAAVSDALADAGDSSRPTSCCCSGKTRRGSTR